MCASVHVTVNSRCDVFGSATSWTCCVFKRCYMLAKLITDHNLLRANNPFLISCGFKEGKDFYSNFDSCGFSLMLGICFNSLEQFEVRRGHRQTDNRPSTNYLYQRRAG